MNIFASKATLRTIIILSYAVAFYSSHNMVWGVDSHNQANNAEEMRLVKEAEHTLALINKQIADASCDDSSQCAALAIGHRACGGPSAFLAYSTKNTDVPLLTRLAAKHSAIEKQLNKLRGTVSVCEILLPPPVICRDKHCQIQ